MKPSTILGILASAEGQERLEPALAETVNRPEAMRMVKPKIPGDAIVTLNRTVSRAHDAKVDATEKWVRGEMSTKKHHEIHARADRVIKGRGRI